MHQAPLERALARALTMSILLTVGLVAAPAQAAPPPRDLVTVVVAEPVTVATGANPNATERADKKAKEAAKKKRLKAKRKKAARIALPRQAMKIARDQKGDPYRYGASGPSAFDCSGLTSYSYKRAGKTIPRSSRAQRAATKKIARKSARVGDLVFFHGGGGVYHVGLYAGGNKILHAPYTGARVRVEKIWTDSVSFGRV